MISPTNGRIVWFTPSADMGIVGFSWHGQDPLPAMICHVWGPNMVNLDVIDSNGLHWPLTSVTLLQHGDPYPEQGRYCEWMPYQRVQARAQEKHDPMKALISEIALPGPGDA